MGLGMIIMPMPFHMHGGHGNPEAFCLFTLVSIGPFFLSFIYWVIENIILERESKISTILGAVSVVWAIICVLGLLVYVGMGG